MEKKSTSGKAGDGKWQMAEKGEGVMAVELPRGRR
jgi:hypothetical protein